MPNIINVEYETTGKSKSTNELGMREMQERAFEARNAQYVLLKAPPASGKSRALMFLGLDKLHKQGIKKVIVAVPEQTIGASFAPTDLTTYGFFADWEPKPECNLCTPGVESSKTKAFVNFMGNGEQVLICTHSTLRHAFADLKPSDFDNILLAIDEFHHVSAGDDNRLGELLRSVMNGSSAHIVAMTGSYFRGDNIPVLAPEDEARFQRVTYNYYEQLNGYEYLKSLGIGYHFYQSQYMTGLKEVLDTDKKVILHIPNVNSRESTGDKYFEVGAIFDQIGEIVGTDPVSGIHTIKRKGDGKLLKVADLVEDDMNTRSKVYEYLRNIEAPEDLDLIIALGTAKEGFDWPYCEQTLTVGYRSSLTEIIQIIGRCTRDSSNKTHAQFTNLIAQPEASDEQVTIAVNNMLKAISCSLLMEQVLAPNFKFKRKRLDVEKRKPGEIHIRGFKEPSTQRVKDIIEADLNDLKAAVLQDPNMLKALPGNVAPEVINKVMIPKIIEVKYPELSAEEREEVRQYMVADSAIKNSETKVEGDQRFIRMAGKFVNVEDLSIDLIDSVNPFQKAFEVLSKSLSKHTFKAIQDAIDANRLAMTSEEALELWPMINEFVQEHKRKPSRTADNPLERRMADAILYLQNQRRMQNV
ncbi:MAG: ATP-dependent helicase [Desulfovibrio sp.]|nr:ATP-dependent helicase [Desulfovibrio sp.]|tara:strand:- start:24770 stop:26689 length:1920 start_codon:yes stop_codon:yes gene_type:complete